MTSSHKARKKSQESTRWRGCYWRRGRGRLLPLLFLFGHLYHVQVVHYVVVVIIPDIGAAKAAASRSARWSATDHHSAWTVTHPRPTRTVVVVRGVIGYIGQLRLIWLPMRWRRRDVVGAVMGLVCQLAGFSICRRCTAIAFDLKHSDARHMWSAAAFGTRHRTRWGVDLSAPGAGYGGFQTARRRLSAHGLRRVIAFIDSLSVAKVNVRSRQARERRV